MKLPKTVKINWARYIITVVDKPGGSKNNIGYINYDRSLIELGNDLSIEQKRVAILHELFHGIFHYTGHKKLNDDEDIVSMLAHNLYLIIKENKEMIKWLVEEE